MLHLFIIDSEAAFRSLFIKRRNIAACLIHSYYYFIEGDAVASVGEGGIDVSVESAGCGEGVTFDTRYLDEAAYGVASHSEVMFESHLGSIFYLGDAATEQLACCAGRHCTGNAHLALASHLGTRYRRIRLHNVSDKSGRCQCPYDTYLIELVALPDMIKHCWQHAARAACRGCHYTSTGGVLLTDSERVREDETARTQGVLESVGLDIIRRGFPRQIQRTRQTPLSA